MMTLYSGTTDPFSQRCRIVLHEKGMDFQIIDVDLDHKPEDLAVMNPYNQVPVLVERDLVLHESNIINEYIDERFPHPQLMPADPVMRARARLSASQRRRHDFFNRSGFQLQTHVARIDPRELGETFDKTIQAIRLFIDHLEHLLASFVVESRRHIVSFGRIQVSQHCGRGCFASRIASYDRRRSQTQYTPRQSRLEELRKTPARATESPA